MTIKWGLAWRLPIRWTAPAALAACLCSCGTQLVPAPPGPGPRVIGPASPGPPIPAYDRQPNLRAPVGVDCRPLHISTLRLLPADPRQAVVAVSVNGRALRMQVDTGAETSVLTASGAARLGLVPDAARHDVEGLGGTAGYGTVTLDTIGLGDEQVAGVSLAVMRLGGAVRLDGLLGADLLQPYQVALDLPGHRLDLYRAASCGGRTVPPWPSAVLPWTGTRQLPIVTATLDGQPVDALLDTGSSSSAIAASAARLSAVQLAADAGTRSFGAGEMPVDGRLHHFAMLRLGPIARIGPALRVIHLDPAIGIQLVAGMDLLAGRRIWLDFPGRRAYLEIPGAAQLSR